MDMLLTDSSGINSLGGFAFQIRVFVYYMLTLDENMQIEFETLEDVNVKKINADDIDNNAENFINKLRKNGSNIAIQVKRTDISNAVAQKVLLNWILLEASENEVSKYVLFTDSQYNNENILFNKTAEEFFTIVQESDLKANAIISKVKIKYNNDLPQFERIYEAIKNKYTFVSIENIDKKIDDKSIKWFRKAGVKEVVYYSRIKELLQHVTVQIMECVNAKKAFYCSYDELVCKIEDICSRFTETVMLPHYSDFKKVHKVDFDDLKVAASRECKQLVACGLSQQLIKMHLGYNAYYENLRYLYMESNKASKIEDIEMTTFENFEDVKFKLISDVKDTPFNRLDETKKRSNTYSDNEQIRYGSSIYLTKNEIEDIQISWKDDYNEEY